MWSRRVRVSAAVAAAALLLLGAIGFFAFGPIARHAARKKVVSRLQKLLERRVDIGGIDVKLDRVRLHDVLVRGDRDGEHPLARIDTITAEVDVLDAAFGDLRIGRVWVDRPEFSLVTHKEGGDNWRDIVDRLRQRAPEGATAPPGKKALRPELVTIRHGSFSFVDERSGNELSFADVSGRAAPGGHVFLRLLRVAGSSALGPRVSAENVSVGVDLRDPVRSVVAAVSGGRVELLPKMVLTGILGQLAPEADGRTSLSFQGGYGGAQGTLWTARGWLDPVRRDGEISVKADRFRLDRIASILAGGPLRNPEKTELDSSLQVEMVRGDVSFRGQFDVDGLTLYDPWLAEQPVENLNVSARIAGAYQRPAHRLNIEELAINFRGVELFFDAFVHFPGGVDDETGLLRTQKRVEVHARVPPIGCQKALNAIPPVLAPFLQGFDLRGTYALDMRLDVDWANLDELALDGIDSTIGLKRCQIARAPERIEADHFRGEFTQTVEVQPDESLSFQVGPSNPDYVPIEQVSPYVINSFLTTEDSGFFSHRGFIVREFRSALIRNLKKGSFVYGASSITMQLVKNLLLYRSKTISRKLQELFLTYFVEQTLGKERILEIYVNIIEFGPRIYGIGAAAQHYFGKHPSELNPVEAAFFSSLLPSPKVRYAQYCQGKLTRWGGDKILRILKKMRERDRLSEDEYQQALNTPLLFRYDADHDSERCRRDLKALLRNTPSTLPQRDVDDDDPDDAELVAP